MTEDTNDDMLFGSYEAICKACDASAPVNDLGLCEDCDAKMDRDLIRKREWDSSASAFGCPIDKREDLRRHIVTHYGEALELLTGEGPKTRKQATRRRER